MRSRLRANHPELIAWSCRLCYQARWTNLPCEPRGYANQTAKEILLFGKTLKSELDLTSTLTHEVSHALAGSGHGEAFMAAWGDVQDRLPLTYWDRLWLQSRLFEQEHFYRLDHKRAWRSTKPTENPDLLRSCPEYTDISYKVWPRAFRRSTLGKIRSWPHLETNRSR